MHYSNVLKDTKKNLKLIADFIGLADIPESAFDEINDERVGFQYMKKRGDRYTQLMGVNKSVPIVSATGLMKKGGVGHSKSGMTTEERHKVEAIAKEILGPKNYDLMTNGFEAIRGEEYLHTPSK